MDQSFPLLNWIDIHVNNLQKAMDFYEQVLAVEVTVEHFDGLQFAVFGSGSGKGGCLIPSDRSVSSGSHLIYFNVHGRIREALALVEELGGSIEQDLHVIGPFGMRAIIKDPDGNRFALHSGLDS